jgi:CheY-like chemotaxis protein
MKTVLIVDDEYAILEVLKDVLEQEGYRVLRAPNGRKGLESVSSQHPDLILLDVMMPIVDGREMFRQLRANPDYERIPVIVMSGASAPLASEEFANATILKKPFRLPALLALIENILGPRGEAAR